MLERKHDYIQYICPIREPSAFNYDAQPLQRFEAASMRTEPLIQARVVRTFAMMLDFWGLELLLRAPSSAAVSSPPVETNADDAADDDDDNNSNNNDDDDDDNDDDDDDDDDSDSDATEGDDDNPALLTLAQCQARGVALNSQTTAGCVIRRSRNWRRLFDNLQHSGRLRRDSERERECVCVCWREEMPAMFACPLACSLTLL